MTGLEMDGTTLDNTTRRILIQEWPERTHAIVMDTARAVRARLGQGMDNSVRAPSEHGDDENDSGDDNDSDDEGGGEGGKSGGRTQRQGQGGTGGGRRDGDDGGEPYRMDERDEQPDAHATAREGGDDGDGAGDEGSGSVPASLSPSPPGHSARVGDALEQLQLEMALTASAAPTAASRGENRGNTESPLVPCGSGDGGGGGRIPEADHTDGDGEGPVADPPPGVPRPPAPPTRTEGGTGLANETGSNRCFINVIVQCLHAYEPLRSLVAGASPAPNAPAPHVALLRALQAIFAALGTAERGASAADPQAAITALDAGPSGGFSLGDRHDATEVLEYILAALDSAIVGTGASAVTDGPLGMTQPSGPVAMLLSMAMRLERDDSPLRYTQWTQYLDDHRLREAVRELTAQTQPRKRRRERRALEQRALGAMLTAWRDGDAHPIRMERAPRVLILALNTGHTAPPREELAATFAGIPARLNLTEAFRELGDEAPYALRALTTFYGAHWMCYRCGGPRAALGGSTTITRS